MLSKTLAQIKGFSVGEHPLVKTLLGGCYNLNPPRPKYDAMWDPDIVINFACIRPVNADLSLSELAQKSTTLIALASLMRVSEIASTDCESISFSVSSVKFALLRPSKSQRSGPRQSFVLDVNPVKNACPVDSLKSFLDRTQELRSLSNRNNVFVGLIAPHAPVSPNTMARWIKTYLESSGVDTARFSAHSTRGAGASKATANGVSLETILRSGRWNSA